MRTTRAIERRRYKFSLIVSRTYRVLESVIVESGDRVLAGSDCTRRPSSGLCSLTDLEAVPGRRTRSFPSLNTRTLPDIRPNSTESSRWQNAWPLPRLSIKGRVEIPAEPSLGRRRRK